MSCLEVHAALVHGILSRNIMCKTLSNFAIPSCSRLLVLTSLCIVLCLSSFTEAQQPTATITSLGGEVMVSIEKGALASGIVGNVLRAGDEIRTHAGAMVGLELSDGSQLELGENTNMTISALAEALHTGTFTSRLNLWRGRVRLTLSAKPQSPGSSFAIQTHNTLVGIQSSESDSEVVYEPNTNKTTLLAHKSDVIVTNLLTGISTLIPEGRSGIIRDRVIQEIARIVQLPSLTEDQQPTATITTLNGDVLVSLQGTSPMPGIAATVLRTGDKVRTQAGGAVVLQLSDGSELTLGENTNIKISSLLKDPQAGARISHLELWEGRIRSVLSAEHQQPGSSFTVQTPNTLVGVTSSEPDSEVMYVPAADTTIVNAHKSDVVVTNLLTGSSKVIPQEHSGIIHARIIQELARLVASPSEILQVPAEVPVPETPEEASDDEKKSEE